MSEKPAVAAKAGKNRRKSRELVLKSIYRLLLNQGNIRDVISEMEDEEDYGRADAAFFRELLNGVSTHMAQLDERLQPCLDRRIAELSPIEHAILCIAAYELMYDLSIPYRVAINEGVELAKLYGGTDGFKYVNGVLDKLAAEVRAGEFTPRAKNR